MTAITDIVKEIDRLQDEYDPPEEEHIRDVHVRMEKCRQALWEMIPQIRSHLLAAESAKERLKGMETQDMSAGMQLKYWRSQRDAILKEWEENEGEPKNITRFWSKGPGKWSDNTNHWSDGKKK